MLYAGSDRCIDCSTFEASVLKSKEHKLGVSEVMNWPEKHRSLS
jgi:hypothetical protein